MCINLIFFLCFCKTFALVSPIKSWILILFRILNLLQNFSNLPCRSTHRNFKCWHKLIRLPEKGIKLSGYLNGYNFFSHQQSLSFVIWNHCFLSLPFVLFGCLLLWDCIQDNACIVLTYVHRYFDRQPHAAEYIKRHFTCRRLIIIRRHNSNRKYV
jgi:hypothetical protein